MSLKIYESATPDTDFSTSRDMTNPLRVSFDGRFGGVHEQRLYLHNDDPTMSYLGITLYPVDNTGYNLTDGTNGYAWKLKAGDQQPLEQEWETIDAGNEITFSGIGTETQADTTSYLPFWLRIEVPRGADVASFDGIALRLTTVSGISV